ASSRGNRPHPRSRRAWCCDTAASGLPEGWTCTGPTPRSSSARRPWSRPVRQRSSTTPTKSSAVASSTPTPVRAVHATTRIAAILNSIILEHPERPGAPAVVVGVGAAIGLFVYALRRTGEGEARTTTRRLWFLRFTCVFVCVMGLVGISWILGMPRQLSYDWTPYHNDAIALNECAARLVLSGRDPYTDLDLFACYNRLAIGPDRTTPLRRGLFANDVVYPTDQEMDDAWDLRSNGVGTNVEFVWRPSYPSLSFLFLLPVVALGIDTNYLYVACLLAAMALVIRRAPSGLRPFFLTALLGAASLTAFTVGGSSDLLYAL